MPLFRVTVKTMKHSNGIRIEKGMNVDVVSSSFSNPVLIDNGKLVEDAFMRIYGISLRQIGALNTAYLDVERIGG